MAAVFDRRSLLLGGAALGLSGGPTKADDGDEVGRPLTPWRPGQLDIHHIATGRGDAALVIAPDGMSLLIDAGASATPPPAAMEAAPDGTRRPGEWIARYARRHLAATGAVRIDTLLVSHIHPDHLGDVAPDTPSSRSGAYRLTGVSDVADQLPVGLVVDRGYPDYAYPKPWDAPFARNYQAFIAERAAGGGKVERFRVGAADQFQLKHDPARYADFEIRNLAANGDVWTGQGDGARSLFPPLDTLPPEDIPDENACSCAVRIRYGAFSYFAAGDLTSHDHDGTLPWRDIETPAAQAAGPVDVAVAAHHGMFDATGAGVVRALRPRAWIIQGWHTAHPSTDALERMLSRRLYPEARDVFATGLTQANEWAHSWLTNRLASRRGHVVVRVDPGGGRYRIVVTDNRDEGDRVLSLSEAWSA